MKVSVSALGNIKEFIPEEKVIKLESAVSLKELKVLAGVPKEKGVSYVVNGRVQKADYQVADSDQVKILMLVGAG